MDYLLLLRSAQGGDDSYMISVLLNSNETYVIVKPQDGLRNNQKYFYTVSAINSFGNATSDQNIVCKW